MGIRQFNIGETNLEIARVPEWVSGKTTSTLSQSLNGKKYTKTEHYCLLHK